MPEKTDDKQPEKRSQVSVDTELRVSRSEGSPTVIEGYSIVYDIWTDIGWYDERINKGAASKIYKTKGIAGLVDHRSELIIGRTGINIDVSEDDKGVFIKVSEPSSKSHRFDQLVADVESGFITGQSFAFRSDREKEIWTYEPTKDGKDIREKREIVEFKEIADFSFVTYPQYTDTTAAKRSRDEFKTSENRGIDIDAENSIDPEYEEFILTNIKNERGF